MALPSQSTGSSRYRARSSRSLRRRRRGRNASKQIFGLVILAVIVTAAVWYWPFGGGGDPVTPGPEQENLAENGAGEPVQPRTASTTTNNGGAAVTNRPTPTPVEQSRPREQEAPPRQLDLVSNDAAEASRSEPVTPVTTDQETTPPPSIPVSRPSDVNDGTRDGTVAMLINSGADAERLNDLILARDLYNRAMHNVHVGDADRAMLRERLTAISDALIFSKKVNANDPITSSYTIRPNDSLSKIVSRQGLKIDFRLLARLNGLADPSKIRVGQTLKLVKGPFHAVVSKYDYRMDLYSNETDTDGNWLYIRSWPVGLGEDDITPVGSWRVRSNSRLVNPRWTNPRTGEPFDADDPMNPIGERWIGLVGTDDTTSQLSGYGIHGTIDLDSIGKQRSMGCVRLLPDDIELVYEFLSEDDCVVIITP